MNSQRVETGWSGPRDVLQPYPDGRWWVIDHLPTPRFPLVCRGNTGEVFPNVVTPLTGSIFNVPYLRGQASLSRAFGMVTDRQLTHFDGVDGAITGVFGGYLYGNVSLARSATTRTPGLTVEMIDRQIYGLTGAPPHRRGPDERSVRASLRATRTLSRGLLRPNGDQLALDQRDVADYLATVPTMSTASDDDLLGIARGVAPFLERMMHNLLMASAFAGFGRSLLERIVARLHDNEGDDELVNRITAGLGTIESAEPALALWDLGRIVADDEHLSALFDAGVGDLDGSLRSQHGDLTWSRFVEQFDAFRRRHGSRGPDEWELASATWGSDPTIALAVVERLRHAPTERDPHRTGARLAAERDVLTAQTRRALPRHSRRLFDIATRAAASYGAQREATKAVFVRVLDPTRRALAELARRSGIAHDDFFLLTIDEVPGALADATSVTDVIDERRLRRDYLSARIPPFWFEGDVPDPSTWELRADRRQPNFDARVIEGIGVCVGSATGPARVVLDPTQPGELEPEDILVAPITDPAWTPLFLAVAGVVVDVGAQQSHAAIVARELGIPAVVSATGASATIPNGATVTVDGSRGLVIVHGPSDVARSG